MAFNPFNQIPGVHIDEISVPGPIPGVGTSTVAIIGPAEKGPINTPTLVTNPTQFSEKFGDHLIAPVFYASHAAHGFFNNGGTICYFVRAGTAVRANLPLRDRQGQDTIVVTAKKEGTTGNDIEISVQDLDTLEAAGGTANLAGSGADNSQAIVDDSRDLQVGDTVLLDDGDGNSERATIAAIDRDTHTLNFTANLADSYDNGTVRVADLEENQERFRLVNSAGIEPGSYIEISQNQISEERLIKEVDAITHIVTLEQGLENAYTLDNVIVQNLGFNLVISGPDPDKPNQTVNESFENLSVDSRHSRYFVTRVESKIIDLVPVDTNPTPAPGNRPAVIFPATRLDNLAAGGVPGVKDNPSQLGDKHFMTAINSLEAVDEVTMLCVPDNTGQTVQKAMIAHCEKMQDRFAILDPQRNADHTSINSGIRSQRRNLDSENGYGAIYYPWISINDPNIEGQILVPPSGHIAGVFANTDEQKGVHKAPANEPFRGVLGLERTLTDEEAGLLNEESVNVLRRIPNRGFRIWGARTIAPKTSTQWRYVNVRRLLLFIEESIQEGTEFAVFEPNNLALWETLKRQVTDFLTRVWSSGALFGATPEEAFRVRIDDELNPPSSIALGQLVVEVSLRPTTPAEFIVFRIIQDASRPIIQE